MTWSGIAGACFECNRPTGSDDRPYCREHRWMEVTAPMPEVDEAVAAAIRESGGSVPAECPCGEGKNPLHALLNCGQPPHLNKSGGSDVDGK